MNTKSKFDGPHKAHSLGGKASAAKLTAEELSARGKKAVAAREAKRLEKAA